MQPSLLLRLRDWGVCADNLSMDGAGQRLEQRMRPAAIGGKAPLLRPDAGSNDPIARSEMGRQSAGDSKADDARGAAFSCRLERGDELGGMIANHRDARPKGDARLHSKAGDCDYVPPSRHSALVLFA